MAALHALCFETPRPWSAEEFEDLQKAPHHIHVQQTHGFAIARQIGDEAELLTIAVDPDHRRHGLGRRMLLELETKLQKPAHLFLEVSAENDTAISFYTDLGFTQSGRRPKYYRKPDGTRIDALVFRKSL